MEAAQKKDAGKPAFTDYDYSNFYYGAGDDPLNVLGPFSEWYRQARPEGYYLYAEPLESAPAVRVRVRNGKTGEVRELINLASYNYLGISYRPEVKKAAVEAVEKFGLGASGSPILSGTFDVHVQLAEAVAEFKDKEAAVLFPTGYSANVGFISSLMRPGDHIFLDQYSHASIVDGAILAKSKTVFFRHNNPMDLERKLGGVRGKKLVVVEGVYSMDGDICVLPEIVDVAKRHGARILIDEAHSTFLFGPNGRGVAEHFGLDKEVDFHLGTFSKSLGGQGGFVCGSKDLIDYVTAFGRSRFFSCNLAPPIAAGLLAGVKIVASEPHLRARLWSNVAYLRRRFTEEGIDIGKSTSQVMPVMVNNDAKVFAAAEKIQQGGLFLQPVTYPAVPKHKSRLRISVSAAHSEEDLETAVQVIARVLREEGDMPELTRYGFRDALSGFFEIPTETARKLLPAHLQPVELHHGSSVLSVTAFDFVESEVGHYGEVVLACVVAPLVKPGEKLPRSAMYPYRIGTTTSAARQHAIERWHLPHWMEDVQMEWERAEEQITVHVGCEGAPVLDVTVASHSWSPVSHLYQSFMKDEGGAYLAQMTLEGAQSEHEDERGRLRLHEHPFNRELLGADVYDVPFREIWMRNGIQLFQPLVQLETA